MKGRVKAVLEFLGLTLENIRTHIKIILLFVNCLLLNWRGVFFLIRTTWGLKIIFPVWTFHNSYFSKKWFCLWYRICDLCHEKLRAVMEKISSCTHTSNVNFFSTIMGTLCHKTYIINKIINFRHWYVKYKLWKVVKDNQKQKDDRIYRLKFWFENVSTLCTLMKAKTTSLKEGWRRRWGIKNKFQIFAVNSFTLCTLMKAKTTSL